MVLRVRVGVRLGHVYGDRKVESFDIVRVVHRYRTFSFSIGLLSLDLMEVDPGIEQVRSSSRTGGCYSDFDLENEAHMNIWVEDVIKVQSIIIIQSRADDIVQCTRQ